jgi:hypothetical protein
VHEPLWHVSVWVQAFPSLQDEPFALSGLLHTPVPGSQTPARWHWSSALQTTGLAPVHEPLWQVSLCVHASPSSQDEPFAFSGLLHTPVPGSQTPAT